VTTLLVATSEGVPLRLDLAGAGSRLLAGMFDAAILAIGYLLVLIAVLFPVSFDPSGLSTFVLGLLVGGMPLVLIGYHVFFHVFFGGQTPGKRALSIAVASADGQPATNLQHVLRALLMPIDVFITVPIPIGLLSIAASGKHQRLGDIVAGTLLVRIRGAAAAEEPFPEMSWSGLATKTLPLTPGAAAHLSPEDREALRDLLTRTELTDQARRTLFVRAAKVYSARLGLGDFDDARVVIPELYLYAREAAGKTAA
jgi:uncharacterized RDD family membrane protein YckC